MSRKSGALTYRIPMSLFRPVAGQLFEKYKIALIK
jgi:hypothetical protein